MAKFDVHGIDVSRYQGNIDWSEVAKNDLDFAFIKATEGVTLRDSQFFCNWDALSEVGIRKGAYHFFRPKSPAYEQAEHFIFMLGDDSGDLPPVLDLEVLDGVSPEQLVEDAKIWLKTVEAVYKVKPIVYTSMKFFNTNLAGHFDDYPLWIARYNQFLPPSIKGETNWSFWQYGNKGKIAGIKGNVDFNVFRGSLNDLDKMSEPKRGLLSFSKN